MKESLKLQLIAIILLLNFNINAQINHPDPKQDYIAISSAKNEKKVVFGCYTKDLSQFKSFAERAKKLGATHITITAEDLPISNWELKPENDPYPAWVITNPGLLKIAPPKALAEYIPEDYGNQIMDILEKRCGILRDLGLKAAFHTFEPQMLPEKVFEDHPEWRGPRVDHPDRSRTPRYAPCITHPEVLALYTEAMSRILQRAPEIEIIQMRTSDSGAGLGWSSRLYAGIGGNPAYQTVPMEKRIALFFKALRAGVEDDNELHINMYNVKDVRQKQIVMNLEQGMAVDGSEGPHGSRFKQDVGSLLYYRRPFSPAAGIPCPVTFLSNLNKAEENPPKRLFVNIADPHNRQLYLDIYEAVNENPGRAHSEKGQASLLQDIAAGYVGRSNSAELVHIWQILYGIEKKIPKLPSAGGTTFILGCVHQRWLTRPFVPPESLTQEQKHYYRRFQFQARTEAHADDLMNLQATRITEKPGNYESAYELLTSMRADINEAIEIAENERKPEDETAANYFRLLSARMQVFHCLIDNAMNAFKYQRILDTAWKKGSSSIAEQSNDVRQELVQVAENEISNCHRLIALLKSETDERLIDHAEKQEEEYQRLLGADLIMQLENKVSLMEKYNLRN